MKAVLAALCAVVLAVSASAAQITVTQHVRVRSAYSYGPVSSGDLFSGLSVGDEGVMTVVYDSDAPDSSLGVTIGDYRSSILSMVLTFGSETSSHGAGGDILIRNDAGGVMLDQASFSSVAISGAQDTSLNLVYRATGGDPLADDSLPLTIDHNEWNDYDTSVFSSFASWSFYDSDTDVEIGLRMELIDAPLTAVPLPTGAGLSLAGLLLIGARRRR